MEPMTNIDETIERLQAFIATESANGKPINPHRLADWLESSLPEMTMERLLDVLVDRWAVKQGEL